MVATQQEELQRIFDLETQQQGHTLYALETSIYVVAVVTQAIHTNAGTGGYSQAQHKTCASAHIYIYIYLSTNTSITSQVHCKQEDREEKRGKSIFCDLGGYVEKENAKKQRKKPHAQDTVQLFGTRERERERERRGKHRGRRANKKQNKRENKQKTPIDARGA